MRFSRVCRAMAAVWLVAGASAYFNIDVPNRQSQWVQGGSDANLVTWTKGLLDGVDNFDVELARMTVDGLTLVARNVPTKPPFLNILLQDVIPGDDYFLIFINSTHGVMYATSPRFTILAPSGKPNSTQPGTQGSVTVTVSGTPHPTKVFATTFAAVNGAVGNLLGAGRGGVVAAAVVGAVGAGVGAGLLVW